jgi:hypothetical protein
MSWSWWKVVSLAWALGGEESIPTLVPKVDYACILRTWRIRGVRVCMNDGRPTTCLIIENAYPCGILETVRKPATSHLQEVDALLSNVPVPSTSSHTGSLQFAETRVHTFVPALPFPSPLPLAVPHGPLFQPDYFSELDALGWRIDWLDRFLLPGCEPAGAWGFYSPRTGFVDNSNEVIASYLMMLRAGRAANDPRGRITVARYDFEPRTGHYVQPILPKRKQCVSIGAPPRIVETDALAKDGSYLLIHFGIFEVCHGCDPVTLAPAREPVW